MQHDGHALTHGLTHGQQHDGHVSTHGQQHMGMYQHMVSNMMGHVSAHDQHDGAWINT